MDCPKPGQQYSESQHTSFEKHLDKVVDIEDTIIEENIPEKIFEMQIEVTEAILTPSTMLPKITFLYVYFDVVIHYQLFF